MKGRPASRSYAHASYDPNAIQGWQQDVVLPDS